MGDNVLSGQVPPNGASAGHAGFARLRARKDWLGCARAARLARAWLG